MYAADPSKNRADALAIVEEVQNQERTQEESVERFLLSFELLHAVQGRVRLKVKELAFNEKLAASFTDATMKIEGVVSVRCNSWCGSVIIHFDESKISQEKLLSALRKMQIGLRQTAVSLPTLAGRLKLLARFGLQRLEHYTPPVVQFTLGAAAFASSLLGAPTIATTILSSLAVLPITGRAAQTAIDEGKLGVDGLDGMAAVLMIAQQNLTAASFMTALIGLGEYIRELTAQRCRKMLDDLLGLAGCSAWLVKGNKRVCIPADQVRVGDVVVVYPGELIPVDGFVKRGLASVNQASLTGESVPVEVTDGQQVLAGTYLEQGKIYIQCEANIKDSRASKVIEMVRSAPVYETKTQNYAAQLADTLVLPILCTAGICGLLTRNLTRVMSVLIFDFSTGIRISAPTAILSSMQRAGRHGILIKSGGAVERLAQVNAIVLDKTGTLTLGEPQVTEVYTLASHSKEEVLAFAAAVEDRLHHPAARAIMQYARKHVRKIPDRDNSTHKTGMGVGASVGGQAVLCGSRRFMHDEKIDTAIAAGLEHELHQRGESLAYLAINGELAGLISYADKLRPEVPQVIKQLRKQGIKKIYMATGDHEHAARSIARIAGIDDVFSNSFPEQKADLVKTLKAQGFTVAVVGDGINDSPALAHADLGISLHSATDVARESSDILLTDNDLNRLPEAIDISRKAMGLVKENLTFVAVPNGVGIVLAATGAIGPAMSTLLNNGSAILAAMNSLRPLFSSKWTRTDERI
ncbi:MAG: heavy metal translocating P-type ATPase [Candidatus Obscuribacterales bacterium]|nr:heavy metal translocating P-type ATPase [Candidatus Obscuribacterales bacterium]